MLSRGQITSTIPLCTPVCGVAITYLAEDTFLNTIPAGHWLSPTHQHCSRLSLLHRGEAKLVGRTFST